MEKLKFKKVSNLWLKKKILKTDEMGFEPSSLKQFSFHYRKIAIKRLFFKSNIWKENVSS